MIENYLDYKRRSLKRLPLPAMQNVPIGGDAGLDFHTPAPKVREAAQIVFSNKPPSQEKLNGGS